jgi:ubiquinone/menaquinone biosynthesis C-methylase UbiE
MLDEYHINIAKQLRQPTGDEAEEVGKRMNEGNLFMNLVTIESLPLNSDDHILEIGMGNGFFVHHLFERQQNIYYTGIDFSEKMIEASEAMNAELIAQGKVNFELGDIAKTPFENESFNQIFTVNTIYFWENVEVTLNEIKRILKPQGTLTIAIRPKEIMDAFPFTRHGFTTYAPKDLAVLLAENGFKINKIHVQEEADLDFFGEKLKNEFAVIQGTLER